VLVVCVHLLTLLFGRAYHNIVLVLAS